MSAPTLHDKESTPLLLSPKGGGRLDPANLNNTDGPQRRRGGPQAPVRQIRTSFYSVVHVVGSSYEHHLPFLLALILHLLIIT